MGYVASGVIAALTRIRGEDQVDRERECERLMWVANRLADLAHQRFVSGWSGARVDAPAD